MKLAQARVWGRLVSLNDQQLDELNAALERARVVGVLDAWARKCPDMRRWFIHNHPAGCVECVLVDNQLEPDGRDRATMRSVRHCTWENCWRAAFANIHALPGRAEDDARAAAAKAIEAGEV